jgi:hypothetical protein
MNTRITVAASVAAVLFVSTASAQVHTHAPGPDRVHQGHGRMSMVDFGGGWMALGMAQVFPTASFTLPAESGTSLDENGLYLTQPALMFNVESPGSRIVLRTTINLEGFTQPDGELTFGGWGEGYLDKRHPHTYLHEAMLSYNLRGDENAGFSISAGKGFAPYGTDDPMMRPPVKYPTNHHLSQILERWTLNAAWTNRGWSLEAGLFGGNEPTSPSDLSNIESFGNSFSARVTHRVGDGVMGAWPWEFAASYGRVTEEHDAEQKITNLFNAAIRHEHDHGDVHMYGLLEASMSDPDHGDGYYSLLAEGSLQRGRHKPYARIELATRPEYAREGAPGTDEFFRYHHDDEPVGSTRWLIVGAGYGYTATTLPWGVRPYAEAQYHAVQHHSGQLSPTRLFGRSRFWTLSAGFRIFLGGDPMRMGAYGVLDPMTMMHRMQMTSAAMPASDHVH